MALTEPCDWVSFPSSFPPWHPSRRQRATAQFQSRGPFTLPFGHLARRATDDMRTASTFNFPKTLTRTQTIKENWGFRKHWRSAVYHTGDLYQDELQDRFRDEWGVESPQPYLQFVRDLSAEWPHLQGLADFMEVGTEPVRWRDFFCADPDSKYTYPESEPQRSRAQQKRLEKTHVSQIAYFSDGTSESVGTYTRPVELAECLKQLKRDGKAAAERNATPSSDEKQPTLRLFVVEDLSRTVIEQLGSAFDIDPEFFRAHVFDYVWYNIRDPLWEPPTLHVDAVRRDWYQLRFCRARYFSSRAQFNQGQEAANLFNIGRKLYEDENKAFWDSDGQSKMAKVLPPSDKKGQVDWIKGLVGLGGDSKKPARKKGPDAEIPRPPAEKLVGGDENGGAAPNCPAKPAKPPPKDLDEKIDGKVGLMRTKATMWKRRWKEGGCDVGEYPKVLFCVSTLLTPLQAVLLLDPTIKEGFPLWRGYRNWGSMPSIRDTADCKTPLTASSVPSLTRRTTPPDPDSPPSPPASFFSDFLFWAQHPDAVLNHTTPDAPVDTPDIPTIALLRLASAEWLTMSQYIKTRLSQIDWEITHPKEFLTQTQIDIILNKLHTWRRLVPQYREMITETQTRLFKSPAVPAGRHSRPSLHTYNTSDPSPLDPFRVEFDLVLSQMEEYERRIDRLTTVVTSAISIVDSRRVERLTLLAMLFVPLSLVGTLFSMSDDITQISDTFGWWAAASAFCVAAMFAWTAWSRKQSLKAK